LKYKNLKEQKWPSSESDKIKRVRKNSFEQKRHKNKINIVMNKNIKRIKRVEAIRLHYIINSIIVLIN
jgi:hypothetical protein